jgi:hypothetical protein
MQQVLNSKERNEGLLKFLLFFLITIILVVLAIFFDFRLPLKENRTLRDKVGLQFQQESDQQKFVSRMNEAIGLLDSIDNNMGKSGSELFNTQLKSKTNYEMDPLKESSSNTYTSMNKAIIDMLNRLYKKNEDLQNLSGANAKIIDLQKQIGDCNQLLRDAQAELQGYRIQKGSGNQ